MSSNQYGLGGRPDGRVIFRILDGQQACLELTQGELLKLISDLTFYVEQPEQKPADSQAQDTH